MKPGPAPLSRPRRQHGMTIVELMIAMTIGLVVLGAVSTLFINVRQTFRSAESMSRIQENARYAIEMMARDIRMAGFIGCGNLESITVNTIANAPVEQLLFANALRGEDSAEGEIAGIALVAADTLAIKRGTDSDVHLVGNLKPEDAEVKIAGNPHGFAANDVLMVSNCTNADVFRATTVAGGGTTTITHTAGNTGSRNGTYGEDAVVMRLAQFVYFVGLNPTTGRPALYRTNAVAGAGAAEELVDNVEDMQILYGVDLDNDRIPDAYRSAGDVADWGDVLTVQLQLLLVSPDGNARNEPQTYAFNGATIIADDRRMRQVFTTTIAIRNRLP